MLNKSLATLYSKMFFATPVQTVSAPASYISAFCHELAVFGYSLDADFLDALRKLSQTSFADVRTQTLGILTDITGSASQHNVLFKKFPYETPNDRKYLVNRVVGFLENEFNIATSNNLLSCVHFINSSLFDIGDFGACPICQRQVDGLGGSGEKRYTFKDVTPLKMLSYASEADVIAYGNALLSRNSSLSQAEVDLLTEIRGVPGLYLTFPRTIFRETLPVAYRLFGVSAFGLVKTATDALRIAVAMSDVNGDLSLKENVKFKFTSGQTKQLLRLLERLAAGDAFHEDLLSHRERWLRVGERLHVTAHGTKFPRLHRAFVALRNNPKSIVTFSRTIEKKMRAKTVDSELLAALQLRPGEFGRRLDFLLRTSAQPAGVIASFATVAPEISTKMLLELRKYFEHRNATVGVMIDRVFIPKGRVNRMQVVADTRPEIAASTIGSLSVMIDDELLARFSKKVPMGKVFIDPALDKIVLPFNRRGDSSTSSSVVKGGRYAIADDADVLRMFVHWTGNIDVDLSVLLIDDQYNVVDHVSFTKTKTRGIIHSGDLQSAPNGGTEFIDLDIKTVMQRNILYAAMSVISFRGENFSEFPCFAGFMERDGLRSGENYEPAAVSLKFDISVPNTTHLPLAFDLVDREIVYIDMAGSGSIHAHVMGQSKQITAIMRAALGLARTKPTVGDILTLHAFARGEIVKTPEVADVVFDRSTLNMDDVLDLTK